jgi:hypothetical protein
MLHAGEGGGMGFELGHQSWQVRKGRIGPVRIQRDEFASRMKMSTSKEEISRRGKVTIIEISVGKRKIHFPDVETDDCCE